MTKGDTRGFIGRSGQLAWLGLTVALGYSLYTPKPFIDADTQLYSLVNATGISVSLFLVWRWMWMIGHWTRALIYLFWRFPRIRAAANLSVSQSGHTPDLALIMVTYCERPEITRAVFASVLRETHRLVGLCRPPMLLVATGSDQDDAIIQDVYHNHCINLPLEQQPRLECFQCSTGKRPALGEALQRATQLQLDPDGALILMDGDTELQENALAHTLPIFRTNPEVAALTTDEHAAVIGPTWAAEWLHFRFGQRHVMMSSLSLTNSLMCLTGRFSVYRASVLDAALIAAVREDSIDHWLWGRYPLLSGDDKSTWFELLKRGCKMIYVPDAHVLTHERIVGNGVSNLYHNMRRWCGNMVRTSERALRLTPQRTGGFIWWAMFDQRLSTWTTLVGPTGAILALSAGRSDIAADYGVWVLFTRTLRAIPAMIHSRRISFVYGPLSALCDWLAALIKIWVLFFPVKQTWFNRGGRLLDTTGGEPRTRARTWVAAIMLIACISTYVMFIAWLSGNIELTQAWRLYWQQWPSGMLVLQIIILLACSVILARRASILGTHLGRNK